MLVCIYTLRDKGMKIKRTFALSHHSIFRLLYAAINPQVALVKNKLSLWYIYVSTLATLGSIS